MDQFFKQKLLGLVVLLIWGNSSTVGQPVSSETDKPNIIIILADDLGFSDLGATGSEIETPNLDRMADNGILFTDMQNTSKCFPSRSTLLTGVYAQQNGMNKEPGEYHNSVMFGQVLKNAGYRTFFVGKHHGTDNPYDWGFDHYWGLRDGAANYFNPGIQRPDDPGPPAQKLGHYPRKFVFDGKILAPFTPDKDYYSTDTWTDWAIQLLDKYRNGDNPFALYLSYQTPHDPLQAPEKTIKKYAGVYDKGFEAIARARYEQQQKMEVLDDRYPRSEPVHRVWEQLSDSAKADQARRMQVYAAMIDRMDQNIGRVIDKLKDMDKWENTLLMFASDNGASAEVVEIGDGPIGSMIRWASLKEDWANVSNTPFRFYKNYSFAGGIKTPFIVHWPEVITKSGTIDHTPLHFIDIMPTLIDITEAQYPQEYKGEKVHPMEGQSLLPLFKGKAMERKDPLFFNWRNSSAIRTDQWKLVRKGKEWRLFDMRDDRTETTNLSKEYPDVADSLQKLWQEWARQVDIGR